MLPAVSNCCFAGAGSPPATQIAKARIAQRPPADRGAVDAVRSGVRQAVVGLAQPIMQRFANRDPGGIAHRVNRIDIGDGHLVGEKGLTGQIHRLGDERGILVRLRQGFRHRLDQALIDGQHRAAMPGRDQVEQHPRGVLLTGLPADERIGVVRGEEARPFRHDTG